MTSLVAAALMCAAVWCAAAEPATPVSRGAAGTPLAYKPAARVASLANVAVAESSGMACSWRQAGVLWTHNDSGDGPRLFATNADGADLATLTIANLRARDWEDMCSARIGKRSWLFVADAGNNLNMPYPMQIIVVEEPKVDPVRRSAAIKKPYAQVIHARFADGWLDCESMAVDPVGKRIYLVTKSRKKGQVSRVYELPLPTKPSRTVHVAKAIATLRDGRGQVITKATAMDISPDGRRAAVLTYGHAWQYVRGEKETWADAFARPGHQITLPGRRQGEAVCFGQDGRTLWTSSEGRPCPLWRLTPAPAPRP